MDIPTTILDLLDVEDTEGFIGGTLFSATHGSALVEHDYHIGMVTQDDLHKTLTLVPPGSVAESWMLRDSMVDKRTGTDSDDAASLIGIFQSAHATFYSEEAANN